jgi:hypothetical protein
MFETKFADKIKTNFISKTSVCKPRRFGDNVEKYDTARQATDDNKIRRMRFARWITKAKNTHT